PSYGFIDRAAYKIVPAFNFQFTRRNGTADVSISHTEYDGVPTYFLNSWPFFGQDGHLYTTVDWDIPRFIFFCQAALAATWQMRTGAGGKPPWFPNILHVHDWHTGLTPFLLGEARWAQVGSVLTIHNMGYQGW